MVSGELCLEQDITTLIEIHVSLILITALLPLLLDDTLEGDVGAVLI